MKRLRLAAGVLLVMLVLAASGPALAHLHASSHAGYTLAWWATGGGGASAGETYALGGTAGQTCAGALAGGNYALGGGFWAGASTWYRTHLPVVMRGP